MTPLFKFFRNRTTKQGAYGYEGYPDGRETYESGSSRTATEHPLEYMHGNSAAAGGYNHSQEQHHRASVIINGSSGDRKKRGSNYRPREKGIEAETSSQESILGFESAKNEIDHHHPTSTTAGVGTGGIDWPSQSSGSGAEIEIEKGLGGIMHPTKTYDAGRRDNDGGVRGGMLGGHYTGEGLLVGHGTPNGGITRTTDVDVEISHLDDVVIGGGEEISLDHHGRQQPQQQQPQQQSSQLQQPVGVAITQPGLAR